jgi:hypothetical protein
MTTRHGQVKWMAVVVATLLAACSSSKDPSATGPAPARSTVSGAVQGFAGGLQVNGIAFRTSGANLRLTDDSATPIRMETEDTIKGHLDDGMVVTVRGTIDDNGGTGEATEIEFHDLMEASIDDKGPGRVRMLGEDLSIDDSTEIVDRHGGKLTPDDLSIGTRVEVSGHGDGKGGMRATFIRVRDDAAALHQDHEVKGYVIAIAGTVLDLSFTKGGPLALRVEIAAVTSPPAIAVGSFVEVAFPEGNPDPDANGILDAVAIHLEDALEAEPQDEVEVEGIVTSVDATGFVVAGRRVEPNADARYVGGTPDDLVVGVKIEAEGILGEDGVLHAHQVKFQASARIDGNLESHDAAASTLTLLGLVVHVTPSTELRDVSLGTAIDGSRIEVRGYPTKDGLGLNATRIELKDPASADRAFLRAVVTAMTPTTSLTMMGLAIDTSAASFRRSTGSGTSVEIPNAADFFAAITPGQTVVKVRWRNPYPTSTSQPVDEAELEN